MYHVKWNCMPLDWAQWTKTKNNTVRVEDISQITRCCCFTESRYPVRGQRNKCTHELASVSTPFPKLSIGQSCSNLMTWEGFGCIFIDNCSNLSRPRDSFGFQMITALVACIDGLDLALLSPSSQLDCWVPRKFEGMVIMNIYHYFMWRDHVNWCSDLPLLLMQSVCVMPDIRTWPSVVFLFCLLECPERNFSTNISSSSLIGIYPLQMLESKSSTWILIFLIFFVLETGRDAI